MNPTSKRFNINIAFFTQVADTAKSRHAEVVFGFYVHYTRWSMHAKHLILRSSASHVLVRTSHEKTISKRKGRRNTQLKWQSRGMVERNVFSRSKPCKYKPIQASDIDNSVSFSCSRGVVTSENSNRKKYFIIICCFQ